MGRKKKDQRMLQVAEALAEAMQGRSFPGRFSTLRDTLQRFKQERQSAQETDPSAALPDWKWKQSKVIEGQLWYSGPYYDLREFCDDFHLPWPESIRFLAAAAFGAPETLKEPPSPYAWRAWRMARTGLGRPQPDEIAKAKQELTELTPAGRRRSFSRGLTQEAVACILLVDETTVRKYIADCKQYIQGMSAGWVMEKAGLPIHYWPVLHEYLSQQETKPGE